MVGTIGNGCDQSDKIAKVKMRKPKYVKPPAPPVVISRGTYECKWCHRVFSKESIVSAHMCEPRRRWQQKDTAHARLGLQAYLTIQQYFHGTKVTKTEEDFRTSDYYMACVKWGRFVISCNCLDTTEYLNWLLKLNVSIDQWNSEAVYDSWLQQRVFLEDAWDAVDRSINCMMQWAEEMVEDYRDYFKKAQHARIITDVRKTLVSGWVVLCSESGRSWLTSLEQSDLDLVWGWLDVPRWQVKLDRSPDTMQKITAICTEAGL